MWYNVKDALTWLRQREKHSRKKEQHVQKLGGSRVNSKAEKLPSGTTADGERCVLEDVVWDFKSVSSGDG